MSETLEYIEAYFEKELSDGERRVFEERCENDNDFANEVAFYIMLREALKEELLEQKKQLWREYESKIADTAPSALPPAKKVTFPMWVRYVAAASLILAIALIYILTPSDKPGTLADRYIRDNYKQLSQNMDASTDSLQQGLTAYNKGHYDKALLVFHNVYKMHPDNSDAKKCIGLSYLMKKDYDNALIHFNELAQKKLFANPGLFLKALTLLERNKGSDKDEAKKLLEQVVADKLEHSIEAEELLKKW